MKTFNLSEISTTKRTEILNEARHNGAVLQKKNTNGEVLEEFVIMGIVINERSEPSKK